MVAVSEMAFASVRLQLCDAADGELVLYPEGCIYKMLY